MTIWDKKATTNDISNICTCPNIVKWVKWNFIRTN